MSDLRQGVLRAVRLLPDVVKIGAEPERDSASFREESHPSNRANRDRSAGKKENPSAGENTPEAPKSETSGELPADPLQELKDQIAALQAELAETRSAKAQVVSRVASLEAELAENREAVAKKEQELAAGVEANREQAKREGREKGHAEGLKSGREAALSQARTEIAKEYRDKLSGLVTLIESFASKLDENFAELLMMNQPRMLRLWQEMLKKMLQREVAMDSEAVLGVLGDLLKRLSDRNRLVIYVNPEDTALLENRMHEEFEDVLRGVRHIELKSDANVDRGSCIVETNLGVYDARWRTQLDQIDSTVESLFHRLGKPVEAPVEGAETTDQADIVHNE